MLDNAIKDVVLYTSCRGEWQNWAVAQAKAD